jgi:hypothetical protein
VAKSRTEKSEKKRARVSILASERRVQGFQRASSRFDRRFVSLPLFMRAKRSDEGDDGRVPGLNSFCEFIFS